MEHVGQETGDSAPARRCKFKSCPVHVLYFLAIWAPLLFRPMWTNLERWQQLCALAAAEQDPEKLLALIREINDILEAKEQQLVQLRKPDSDPPGK